MKLESTSLKDCFLITPVLFKDNRGHFFESFNKNEFRDKTGIDINFVQDNQSMSSKGVLRGLHFQKGQYAQAKLIRVAKGKILDVCVDIRPDSETFMKWIAIVLDDVEHKQLFIPRGFAHGFLALEDQTIVNYKCDNFYNKDFESGIIYNDKTLNIDWNLSGETPVLSQKDLSLPVFESLFQ
ncbi:MAG: dTDP-4-dehydrorhamnose 3,5-epimerase [Flavobacteriaceae bacterium]|nr:dTDP-4-dehydrorhamnose 3,5-epimerase [Flavobacteriaceae bacterium]